MRGGRSWVILSGLGGMNAMFRKGDESDDDDDDAAAAVIGVDGAAAALDDV